MTSPATTPPPDVPTVTAHKLTLRDGEIRRACDPPHPADHRCFECATDDELAAAIPPFGGLSE